MSEKSNILGFGLFLTGIPFYAIGFVGNVLAIRIVHKTREMHTPTNYLLASMAISDVITIVLSPLYLFQFAKFVCKVVVLFQIAIVVSSVTITVLAVERYNALLKPFRTGLRLSEDNIKKLIALIWFASILICLPEFFLNEWSEHYSTCVGAWTLHMNYPSKIYVVIIAVLSSYIPLAVVCYCYGSLIRGLYFTNTVCPETDEDRSPEKRKLVTTFLLVTVGFFIGNTPTAIFYTGMACGLPVETNSKLYYVLHVIVFVFVSSLCFNPIIYAFRSTNFREGFKRIILCRKPPQQNEISL